MGSLRIVTGSYRVIARSLVIVMGRYGIVSELFEIVYGPSSFLKNRCGILRDRPEKLDGVVGTALHLLA